MSESGELNPNLPFAEQFRIISRRWVDADGAATLLEETKTATLAQEMAKLGGVKSIAAREMAVKASDPWHEYLEAMVAARKKANLLKVQLEYIRMKHWENNSVEATRRAEMGLSR